MPYVRRKTDNVLIRIDVFYKQIMALKFGVGVDECGNPLRPNESQERLAKEIFGQRVVDAAPNAWHRAESFLTAEMFPHEWERVPIHSRARWLAAKRIDGMVKVLERYREVIERKNKETLSKMKPRPAALKKRR